MKSLRAIYIIWYRDILRLWRDKARIVGSLAFPLLFLLVFGTGLGSTLGMFAQGMDYAKFLFPGIIGMTVLMTSFTSGMSVVWDREFGFLKEVLVAPVSRWTVVAGKVLGGGTVATMQGMLILPFAPLLGVSLTPLLVVEIIPLMLLMASALGGLGILIASRMRSMEAFMVIMNVTMMPMIFLSGVFFPVEGLPSWLNALVKINPVTYGVDPIRQLFQSNGIPGITLFGHSLSIADDIFIVVGFGLLMIGLAMWSFGHQE